MLQKESMKKVKQKKEPNKSSSRKKGQIQEKNTRVTSNEERFRTLFDEAPIALFVHDKDTGEIVDANQAAINSYGYNTLDDLQQNHNWAGPPHSFEEAFIWIRKACTEGPQHFEWCSSRKDGTLFWEDVYLRRVNIGGIERILATCSDITQRKKAEEALRESEDKYRSIVEQSSEMLFLHDMTGKFLEVNRAAIVRTGYSRDDLLSMTVFDLHADSTNSVEVIHSWKILRVEDPSITVEVNHRCKEGVIYPAEVCINKILLRDQEYILSLVRDLTERKQAEVERETTSGATAAGTEDGIYWPTRRRRRSRL